MSSADNCEEAEGTSARCASCDIAENDDVKLKNCSACYLVRYCGVECQKEHRPQHKKECKKRAAELRDELLFKQPDSSCYGDCPICMIPLPLDPEKSSMCNCCSKVVCKGCEYANDKREMELRLVKSCPFCREPIPKTEEEWVKQRMKRIEANDPAAMVQQGGDHLIKGEYQSGFEYFAKAAALGNTWAHFNLACLYHEDVHEKIEADAGKMMYHLEEAAIGGHPGARHNLGLHENVPERAVKHFIIAATQGEDNSIKALMEAFKMGWVEKEDLAAALRSHQAAVDATKSPQRDEAEKN